jgi:hypothetical protein
MKRAFNQGYLLLMGLRILAKKGVSLRWLTIWGGFLTFLDLGLRDIGESGRNGVER